MCKRGEIYYCNLGEVKGSEQGGYRPVLVIQNDKGNQFSTTTIIIALTTKRKHNIPVHVDITEVVPVKSTILCEQIRTVEQSRLGEYIGKLSDKDMARVEQALKASIF